MLAESICLSLRGRKTLLQRVTCFLRKVAVTPLRVNVTARLLTPNLLRDGNANVAAVEAVHLQE
jgi:hypothetical protein